MKIILPIDIVVEHKGVKVSIKKGTLIEMAGPNQPPAPPAGRRASAPIHVTFEPNVNNSSGFALTLWYSNKVAARQVADYIRTSKAAHPDLPGWAGFNDPYFEVQKIGDVGNMERWQAYP